MKADYISDDTSRTRQVAVATCSDIQSMLLDVMPDWATSNEPEAIQFREDVNELVMLAEKAAANGTQFSKTMNKTDSGLNGHGICMPRNSSGRMFVFNISESTSVWLAIAAVSVLFAAFSIIYM